MRVFNSSKLFVGAVMAAAVNMGKAIKNKVEGAALAVFGAFGLAASMTPGKAHAALTLDSAAILADIATAAAFITLVGLAVLGLVFTAKAIKYARRAG